MKYYLSKSITLVLISITVSQSIYCNPVIHQPKINKKTTQIVWEHYAEAFKKDSIQVIKPYLTENWQLSQMPNGIGSTIMLAGIIHLAHERGITPTFKVKRQQYIGDTLVVELDISIDTRKAVHEICKLISSSNGFQIVHQSGRMLDLFQNEIEGGEGIIETTITKQEIQELSNSNLDALTHEDLKHEVNKIIEGDTLNRLNDQGLPMGKWKRTYKDGSFMCEGEYINGLKEGFWQKRYENGRLMYQCHYLLGEYHGTCKNYYPNGNLKDKGDYLDGQPHGKLYKYYENGNLRSIENYSHGKFSGESEYFKPSGKPIKKK